MVFPSPYMVLESSLIISSKKVEKMKKIEKPSPQIHSLLLDKGSTGSLKEWIELLTSPFKNSEFAPNCFTLASVLDKETQNLLFSQERDLVRIDFPTTISGLYQKTDEDYRDEGYLILSINNKACIHFATRRHSVLKYQEMFSDKEKSIVGTYEEVVKVYLEYLNALMAIPKLSN